MQDPLSHTALSAFASVVQSTVVLLSMAPQSESLLATHSDLSCER
jgi:hypothetical protein